MPAHDATPQAQPAAAQAPESSQADPGRAAAAEPDSDTGPRRPAGMGQLRSVLARVPRGWRAPIATYLGCQAILLLWWAAFYPGLMSYDTVIYVLHVTTGPWINNLSVLYDSMVWLSLHTTGSLAPLTFLQTMAMSAAFAYTVFAFRRLGVPGRWTAIAAIAVAALPPTGAFIIFIWKDVPFTICAFLIVPTLAHLVSLRRLPGRFRHRRTNQLIAALGLEFLGLMLFRANGFIIVVLAAAALVCLLPGVRARLAAVSVAAVLLSFFLNYVVYPAAGIKNPSISLTLGPAYSDIAVAYAERPSSFTSADKSLMTQVAPLAEWARTANCYDSDWTTNIHGFNKRSPRVSGQLFSLWLRVLQRSPDLILGARICRGSIAWSIFPGPGRLAGATLEPDDTVPANLFLLADRVRGNPYRSALRVEPLSTGLNVAGNFLWNVSRTPQLQWLLWRGPFWCYLSYLMLFAVARARRNWALLGLGAIIAAQQLGVMIDIPAQLYRYMISPIFIGIMLIPLFFARKRPAPVAGNGAAVDPPTTDVGRPQRA